MEPAVVALLRRAYRAFAGPEASISTLPRAVLRKFCGNDFTIKLRGKPFTVNLLDAAVSGTILAYRKYEVLETTLMQRVVKPGDFVLDVGANIGYFSVLLGELVGPAGRVAAFEPEPNNVRLLQKNVADRGLGDIVEVFDAAVGDDNGVADLFLAASENMGDHQLYKNDGVQRTEQSRASVQVRVVKIDDAVAAWPRVDFVKMDIQGFEPHALAGMRATLTSNPGIIFLTEFWPFGLRVAGAQPLDYLRALRSHGLRVWEVSERRRELIELEAGGDEDYVVRLEPDRNFTNLLCARDRAAVEKIGTLLP